MNERQLYGVLAMFDSAEGVLAAARAAREAGFTRMDAYTPFPVEGLADTLGFKGDEMRWWVLAGGIMGGILGYLVQWWTAVVDYPLNIGGRPIHAWPSFMLVTFEMAVLLGAFGGFFGMLYKNGLPRLNHPVFNAHCFQLESRDRFFLCIEAEDPRFDPEDTAAFLGKLNALEVTEVIR
ncbi:MAG: DUF3341 domain-containing protein [Candidatus Competibacteraceae bacterium]|nr:DUF3341 domain-containing protein [Candidatus Competibacteraceae bacterium]